MRVSEEGVSSPGRRTQLAEDVHWNVVLGILLMTASIVVFGVAVTRLPGLPRLAGRGG